MHFTSGSLQPRTAVWGRGAAGHGLSVDGSFGSSQTEGGFSSSPTDQLLQRYFQGGQESDAECSAAAANVLDILEDSPQMAGMFKAFLRTINLPPLDATSTHHQLGAKKRPRAPDTELPLLVSLEELYTGCSKRFCLDRHVRDAAGGRRTVRQTIHVVVQAGMRQGCRITLPGLGHQDGCGQDSDLVLVIQQARHGTFRRLNDDLYAIVTIPLVTALTGGQLSMQHLNGRRLQLPLAGVVVPGSEVVVSGEGMPVLGQEQQRGNLHVRLEVAFPRELDASQRCHLRRVLCSSTDNSSSVAAAAGDAQ